MQATTGSTLPTIVTATAPCASVPAIVTGLGANVPADRIAREAARQTPPTTHTATHHTTAQGSALHRTATHYGATGCGATHYGAAPVRGPPHRRPTRTTHDHPRAPPPQHRSARFLPLRR